MPWWELLGLLLFSLAWWPCCCGGGDCDCDECNAGCPSTIDVTVTGVADNACTGCGAKHDGTYSISPRQNPDSPCFWQVAALYGSCYGDSCDTNCYMRIGFSLSSGSSRIVFDLFDTDSTPFLHSTAAFDKTLTTPIDCCDLSISSYTYDATSFPAMTVCDFSGATVSAAGGNDGPQC